MFAHCFVGGNALMEMIIVATLLLEHLMTEKSFGIIK